MDYENLKPDWKKSQELREFVRRYNKNHHGANPKGAELVEKIKIRADFLEGQVGMDENQAIVAKEQKQLRSIEKEVDRGNIPQAMKMFMRFIHEAYDTKHATVECAELWALTHYVDMNYGVELTYSDHVASKLLDATKVDRHAEAVVKRQHNCSEPTITQSQQQRIERIYKLYCQGTGKPIECMLDEMEDMVMAKAIESAIRAENA